VQTARERDRGTFEVLCFGPVDEKTFLLGGFIAQMKVFGFIVIGALVWANLATWLLHLAYSKEIYIFFVQSMFMAASVISLGILTAVWGNRTRTTLVYYFTLILLFVGVQVGDSVVNTMVTGGNQVNESLLLLRNALITLSNGIEWVSPFAQMELAMTALAQRAWLQSLLHSVILLVQAAVILTGSIIILQRKESRR